MMVKYMDIKTGARTEFKDISDEVQKTIKESGIEKGICSVYVPHTTAGIIINEGADPSVQRDIQKTLERLIPFKGNYTHAEGNSPAHIKSVLTGTSQSIIIDGGKLLLGTWQSVFFCEFDGPRSRRVVIKVISDDR
jgi:secondary thiamine-phosphate synthase enzyme